MKLQQNCYNGFVPDMKLLLDYADYYADLMSATGWTAINFDGFESTVYQNHGYYGVRVFCGGCSKPMPSSPAASIPHVTGSNVFAGAWEYMDVCNVGGGNNMFNPVSGRWGIEGKDIGNAFSNSYFPPPSASRAGTATGQSTTRRTCKRKPSAGTRPTP